MEKDLKRLIEEIQELDIKINDSNDPLTIKEFVEEKKKSFVNIHALLKEKNDDDKEKDELVKSQSNTPSKFFKPRFSINGVIFPSERNKSYYYLKRDHSKIKKLIEDGAYCLLYGPRSSSKTTTIYDLMEDYKYSKDYYFVFISISPSRFNNTEEFWVYFFSEIKSKCNLDCNDIGSKMFLKENKRLFKNKSIVLFIDEFDSVDMEGMNLSKIFSEIRTWKQDSDYNVHSCICAGPFDITRLEYVNGSVSPFNIAENLQVSTFSLEQIEELFNIYHDKTSITIEKPVIEDIYNITNGHPGLVCLCGRSIDEKLNPDSNSNVNLDSWVKLANSKLYQSLSGYRTVQNLMDILHHSDQKFRDFLYKFIVKFPDPLCCLNQDRSMLYKLLSHGYIRQVDPVDQMNFCLSSQLLKYFILFELDKLYKRQIPTDNLPIRGGKLDIPFVIKSLVPLFRFQDYAVKLNRAEGSVLGSKVPAEFFYHVELISLLSNWGCGTINIIPSLTTRSGTRPDIIVKTDLGTYVLELCAHVSNTDVAEHVDRAESYRSATDADESWIINFTTSKKINFKKSKKDVGIIHVYHTPTFDGLECTVFRPEKKKN